MAGALYEFKGQMPFDPDRGYQARIQSVLASRLMVGSGNAALDQFALRPVPDRGYPLERSMEALLPGSFRSPDDFDRPRADLITKLQEISDGSIFWDNLREWPQVWAGVTAERDRVGKERVNHFFETIIGLSLPADRPWFVVAAATREHGGDRGPLELRLARLIGVALTDTEALGRYRRQQYRQPEGKPKALPGLVPVVEGPRGAGMGILHRLAPSFGHIYIPEE